MGTSAGYRIRQLRLLDRRWGPLLVGLTVLAVAANVADLWQHDAVFIPFPLAYLLIFPVAALWPVRILAMTKRGMGFREHAVTVSAPYVERTYRFCHVAWPDVAEIFLTSRDGRVVMVAGLREPGTGTREALIMLPVRDEQEVAEAVFRIAPGVAVHRGRLADILTRTRRPYVLEHQPPRRPELRLKLILLALAVAAAFTPAADFLPAAMIVVDALWSDREPLIVAPEAISLGTWWSLRAVPWTAVASVRLSADDEGGGVLTVRLGRAFDRYAAGRELTQRIPGRADFADLEAVVRAYAPPWAVELPA